MHAACTRIASIIGVIVALYGAHGPAYAHPGSGIAVDDRGSVYFVHAEVGVWMVDSQGALLQRDGPGYHFMIADPQGHFAAHQWPRFPDGEIRVVGADPALLLASSFPVAIGPDGALYYPEARNDDHVHIMRVMPSEDPTDFATLPDATEIDPAGEPIRARWIHGLASGPDGALYYTEKNAVRRIDAQGNVSLVAGDIAVPGCDPPPAIVQDSERMGPALRGLDVASDGTIYAAASGCSALIQIRPDGKLSVALRSPQPWAPTGVAVVGSDVYVLEYSYTAVERAGDWLPRVRKFTPGGEAAVLATVETRPR